MGDYKILPTDQTGKVVSKGTSDKGILCVDVEGSTYTASNTEFRQFFIPAGESCGSINIKVGNPRPTAVDPDDVYESFFVV